MSMTLSVVCIDHSDIKAIKYCEATLIALGDNLVSLKTVEGIS